MFEMTPSVIDARSCVPFEPQKLEFISKCQNFIELPRCPLESHTQSVLNGPIKKSLGDLVDLLILSVGRVEDDKDVIPVRAAFFKL
jgi:hypothetical protein